MLLLLYLFAAMVGALLDGCVATICRGLRIAKSPSNWDHQEEKGYYNLHGKK